MHQLLGSHREQIRWWLQHPSKDDEACAISGKRTTNNSKLNTSIRYGVRRGADFGIFQQYQSVIPGYKSYRGRSAISIIPGRSQARARGNRYGTVFCQIETLEGLCHSRAVREPWYTQLTVHQGEYTKRSFANRLLTAIRFLAAAFFEVLRRWLSSRGWDPYRTVP